MKKQLLIPGQTGHIVGELIMPCLSADCLDEETVPANFGQARFFLSVQHISIFGRYTWCGDTHDEVPGTPS